MKHCKYFFIVYAIAMLSSVGANAATVTGLATPEYVKGAINSLPAVARSGSYNDLSNKPTLGTMAAKNNITNADISGTIEQGKITGLTGALSGKQATLTTTNVKDSGTGNVVTGVSAANGVVTVTKGSITSANNPTITIKQGGTSKGSFTLNQSGAATIELTDNNTTYGIATSDTAGLVKSGNDISVNSTTGAVTVKQAANATTAGSATKATQDAAGNVITSTYAKQADMVKAAADVANVSAANKTTKYPSIAAAEQIAAVASATAMMNLVTEDGAGVVKSIVQDDAGGFVVEKGSIVSDDIEDGTIVAADLASNSVTTVKITNLNVTTDKLAADAVTNAKLADNAVNTENIVNGGVQTADIAASAVTTAKIADLNVTTDKLAADAVTNAKIANAAVTPAKTSGVVGYIPSGSATATTYAQIWVQ